MISPQDVCDITNLFLYLFISFLNFFGPYFGKNIQFFLQSVFSSVNLITFIFFLEVNSPIFLFHQFGKKKNIFPKSLHITHFQFNCLEKVPLYPNMIFTRCKGLKKNVFLVYLEGALTSLLEKMMDLISPLEK
jgi:hypothetical protein